VSISKAPEPIPAAVMIHLAEAFDESDLPWKINLIDWTTSERFGRSWRGILLNSVESAGSVMMPAQNMHHVPLDTRNKM
jgi:hypothetical protein